jgi:hypothetical protein
MRLRREQGQAATETMLSMMFMLMMIFGSVQLCWWSMNKYLANLAAFGAARTAMVGGPQNEQMIAARQIYNARGTGPGPRLVPMSRTYGGGGGSGGGGGGLLNNLLNGVLQGLRGPLNLIVVPLQAQLGLGSLTGGSLSSDAGGLLFQLGLPTNLGSMLGGMIDNALGNLTGLFGGGVSRQREGLAYILSARGGLPIQDGVRVVGWTHVVIQPSIGESGDNAGGYYGGFAGFSGLGGLGGLFGGISQLLGPGGLNINQLMQNATSSLQQLLTRPLVPPSLLPPNTGGAAPVQPSP